jgi:hypothetical protein
MPELEITGYCWNCGRQCNDLFCNNKGCCKKAYERRQAIQNKVKSGKRANYGVTGI